ncbi:phytochrome-like protein cph2 [mine drainage metagenome]|uniref:Phytochrome-like protein cph2 n=1 Tax=mine drainage metagenome TaxID=410659 RepID=A0A1J5QTT5_9ZZZZ
MAEAADDKAPAQAGAMAHAAADPQRLTRALRLVSECNSVLVRVHDERALLDAICRLVVESGGYLMAWIGYAEHDAQHGVRPVAQSGHEADYLSRVRVTWDDSALGRGPTGTAIRTGATQVNQNWLTNPRMAPWRDAALQRGYQSSIALPLRDAGGCFGALTIYGVEPDAFNADEVALLEQLADDLAFGIGAARTAQARRHAVAALQAAEQRWRLVLDNAADAVLLTRPDGRIDYANRQAAALLGRSLPELLGAVAEQALRADAPLPHGGGPGASATRAEAVVHRADGSAVPVEVNVVRLPDGNDYASYRDISERKRYEAQLEYMATHDALTGLANRALLADRTEQAVVHARRGGQLIAALLLDLDRFKVVNDSYSHAVGDALLREIALRLRDAVRDGDTVARLGGDEFMILMTDLDSADDVARFARRLLATVAQPLHAAGHELVVTASLGAALYPRDGELAATLMRNADLAMYRAKDAGRAGFAFYAADMNQRMRERLELESGLRRALDADALQLHFQPQVDLRDGRIAGAEALLRWPGGASPAEFIPLAEETGLIQRLGAWVIDRACAAIRRWSDAGLDVPVIAVNVSARQFQHDELPDQVAQALQRHAVDPRRFEIELTESAVMDNPQRALDLLGRLAALGVRTALDDFGTGYSSLAHLKRLPIGSLKIDQSFVHDLTIDADDAAIARLVIALGHDLGQRVVAEGVETAAQLQFLRRHGCDAMQGFLFSRPLPADDFAELLRSGRRLDVDAAPAAPR